MVQSKGIDRVNVVALIVRKNDKVLLERRKKNRKVDPGKIAIPGGHVEKAEALEQTCKRELEEELGLECSDFRHVATFLHDTASEKQMVHYYSCENWTGVPRSREADTIFWASIENLKCLDYDIDRRAIKKSLKQTRSFDTRSRTEGQKLLQKHPSHGIVGT